MAAVTFEEEVSRQAARAAAISPALVRTAVGALARSRAARAAADALFHLFAGTISVVFAATFLCLVVFRACVGNCTVALVVWEILVYSGMLSLLLMAPAMVLFFLRAAGSGSEIKDDVDGRVRRWPLIWDAAVAFFHLAALVGLIGLVLLICGAFQEVSYLLRTAAVMCKLLLTVLFSIRAAVALWRMNPRQPAAVAVAVV
ncbi:uncharacterized protein [Aegilops tauschii subsp. strangulata]|uniref:Uncharacterized protein n=1 Tax=Aegilops tauschii subsp. strangulata TaxID=200361 RepID=A0A453N6G2_AEGTS|nr:uncharacterized protein LOC109757210 [Aegilops tauschii subsp. strangulata]XP_044416268.1 uncharacterized protein LOC123141103 [Triticum aestivum]